VRITSLKARLLRSSQGASFRQRREKQLIAEGTLFIYFVGNFFYKEGVHFYLLFR